MSTRWNSRCGLFIGILPLISLSFSNRYVLGYVHLGCLSVSHVGHGPAARPWQVAAIQRTPRRRRNDVGERSKALPEIVAPSTTGQQRDWAVLPQATDGT